MTAKLEHQQERLHCCISHEFVAAASRNPTSIAVVHASGGARLSRELRGRHDFRGDAFYSFFTDSARSLSPPVYEGDECFTFSEVSLAVDSLSRRLRAILDGGHDPHLARPSGSVDDLTEQFSFVPSSQKLADSSDSYVPKVVAIFMPPSVDYIVAVLSVLRCGAAFLPIDPWWPKGRILSAISSSKVELIVGSRTTFGKSYEEHWILESRSSPILWFSMDHGFGELKSECNIVFPCEYDKKRLFCYLMYTSGSSGVPKGVCGTEQGLLNRFLWMQEYYPPQKEEYLLFKTSISFIDHLQELLGAILSASVLVVPPSNELKENIFAVIDFLEAYRISRLTAVPSMMREVLPSLQRTVQVKNSLHLLVLSGEDFPISLWKMLSTLLPSTSILNLYGSTEVSGDCTCFDCKWLPSILDKEQQMLTSVPIGHSISKCEVVLVGQPDIGKDQGEIHVGGTCLSVGCFSNSVAVRSEFVELHQGSANEYFGQGSSLFFRTGDLARRLSNGDLIFLGRKDRTMKINGQRIALEEIESTLREHPDVVNAVVLSCKGQEELVFLEAFVLLQKKDKSHNMSKYLRRWLVERITSVMIPRHFVFLESFPLTLTGKVDYEFLSTSETIRANEETRCVDDADLLEIIKDAFCDALMVEEVSNEDDFFTIGGNSITAAHVSHNLGINMKMLYAFPTPSKLREALLQMEGSDNLKVKLDTSPITGPGPGVGKRNFVELADSEASELVDIEGKKKSMRTISGKNGIRDVYPKHLKAGFDTASTFGDIGPRNDCPWRFQANNLYFSLSRCNRVMYEARHGLKDGHQGSESVRIQGNVKSFIQRLWKIHMESCVDASPLLVARDQEIYAFIGSHAHKFVCVNAKSCSVQWEINLDDRIECSAAITDDFSQIVVGCYKGKIYFLDFFSGKIRWTFQTAGEVKSQPAVDRNRHLIWCGSHDCNLYALDYKNYQCVFRIACKGSIFGSPAIDELNSTIYVASTGGFVTAVSIKGSPFKVLWQHEVEVPVFGSICICPHSRNVICCLVDGSVIALDLNGAISWKTITDGPIFAGACISSVLPSQALICSRSGKLFSFNTVNGNINWEYNVGEPMTASAYIDEHIQLISDRLVCICTSSGSVIVLRVRPDPVNDKMVEELARLKLDGEIFSSPVMLGGVIFVGCRDDYFHCLAVETRDLP